MCHVSLPPKARRTLGETRYIAANFSFRVFGPLAVFTVTARSVGWRWLFRLQFSLKCLPKFVTGPSSPRQWKQLVPHQVRCMSAPKHWQKASSIQCPRASLKLHTASPLWPADGSRPTHCWAFFYSWPLLIKQRGRVDERDPQGWKTLTWYFDNLAGFVA